LYVGSADGNVYALNATTGSKVWSYTTPVEIYSSPAVSGGIVYIGSDNDYVYALNATTGSYVWSYETGTCLYAATSCTVFSSPAVSGGIVYVGSKDDYVYALNATTGSYVWSYETGNAVRSSAAVSGGIVYVGSEDDKVYALNATTGAFLWNYTTGNAVDSSPAVSGGIVYVGSEDDKVYALNATTGSKVWNYTTGAEIYSSPAVSGGILYVGSADGNVYALNATTGSKVWSYTTGNAIYYSSPAVSGSTVYIGSFDDKVYALNATTGAFLWNYTTGDVVNSSPAVSGGNLYLSSWDAKVYAFGQTSITVTSSPSGSGFVTVDKTPAPTAPEVFSWAIGSMHNLTASSSVISAGVQYVWVSWSDGGARSHDVVVSSLPTTYTANFKFKNYVVKLDAGWNLMSLQVVPANPSITALLSALIRSNEVGSVWGYSAATKSWSFYLPGKPSTLSTMVDGQGYWVYMTQADTLYFNGTVIPPTMLPSTYSLSAGWNLVGFKPQPTIQSETVSQYLSSINGNYDPKNVWVYTNAGWVRADSNYTLEPGQAMWILMTAPATLRP
jgi:outer membrane protein assembly factor BamB